MTDATRGAARATRTVDAWGSAAATIGPITPGCAVFFVSRGQFGMLDIVRHVVAEIGPSEVSIWTWAVADNNVRALSGFMADGGIVGASLICDRSAEQRSPVTFADWRGQFGPASVRVCQNHCKMARIWTADRHVLVRGSLNFNFNPRFEQIDLTEGGPEFAFVAGLEASLPVLAPMSTYAEADAATGVSKAFLRRGLPMLAGVKPWSK